VKRFRVWQARRWYAIAADHIAAGHDEEAVRPAQIVVWIYRRLAAEDPAQLPNLAASRSR
jgi:hypothetical protein